jgi:hypothetical protein
MCTVLDSHDRDKLQEILMGRGEESQGMEGLYIGMEMEGHT